MALPVSGRDVHTTTNFGGPASVDELVDSYCVQMAARHEMAPPVTLFFLFIYLVGKDYHPCFTVRYTTGYLQYYVQS